MITIDLKTGILAAHAALEADNLQACIATPDGNGACLYRDDGGSPCYVGAMFSDGAFAANIEGRYDGGQERNSSNVGALIKNGAIQVRVGGLNGTRGDAAEVLTRLQLLHDEAVQADSPTVRKARLSALRKMSQRALDAVNAGQVPKL